MLPQGPHERVHAWPRGKLLGGSSSVNFSMIAKPSKTCIDDWAALGNPGWDWDGLLPYYRKFMTLNPPPADTGKTLDTTRMQKFIGDGNGPIQASWPPLEYTSIIQKTSPTMADSLGLKGGDSVTIADSTGFYDQALAIDMKTGRRSSVLYDYYLANASRPNLFVITDAMAKRIVFSEADKDGKKVATGVNFAVQGQDYSASAKKEVILCCGTIQSPQLLELSGIGSKSILEKYGITVLVDNPGVGENLQDHVMTGIAYEAAEGVPTVEDLKLPGVMEMLIGEYLKVPVGPLVNQLTSCFYTSYSDTLDDKSKLKEKVEKLIPDSQTTGKGLAKQMKIQRDRLLNSKDCAFWFTPFPGGMDLRNVSHGAGIFDHKDSGHYLGFAAALTHPLSRGSTHIQSPDVNVAPIMDPRYLSHPADLAILAEGIKHVDSKMTNAKPFADLLKGGSNATKMPTFETFSHEKAEDHVQEHLSTQWHILGTCSMLPEEDGGVVDPTLKVYGTANLRVVDASIIPLEVQGNIQTAVYALAEKGADLVKETW